MFEQDGTIGEVFSGRWRLFNCQHVRKWEAGNKGGNVKGKKEISIQKGLVKICGDIHYTAIPGLLNDPKYLSMLRNLMFFLLLHSRFLSAFFFLLIKMQVALQGL